MTRTSARIPRLARERETTHRKRAHVDGQPFMSLHESRRVLLLAKVIQARHLELGDGIRILLPSTRALDARVRVRHGALEHFGECAIRSRRRLTTFARVRSAVDAASRARASADDGERVARRTPSPTIRARDAARGAAPMRRAVVALDGARLLRDARDRARHEEDVHHPEQPPLDASARLLARRRERESSAMAFAARRVPRRPRSRALATRRRLRIARARTSSVAAAIESRIHRNVQARRVVRARERRARASTEEGCECRHRARGAAPG